MKARQALANVTRSAALVAMALVVLLSLQAGVELVFAVLRGMVAFVVVQWVLGAAAEVVAMAAFRDAAQRRPKGAESRREPSPPSTLGSASPPPEGEQ